MEKQFNILKEAILSRLERSDNAKLRKLCNNISMSDRTPFQLLRFMKSLLGCRRIDESIIRQLWFKKLSQSMTNILMAFSKEKMPSQLAKLADRITDTYHQKTMVSKISTENHKEDNAVSQLREKCSMDIKGQSRPEFHRSVQSKNSSKNRSPPGKYLCFYHFMFHKKVHQSVKPCSFLQKDLKRPHQQVMVTTPAGNTKVGRLLYIQNLKSKRFLVDTGAEISVIPPTSTQRTSLSNKT